MAQFDLEEMVSEFVALFQANLNTKITALNTEKGDSELTTFTNEQYINDLNKKVMNYSQFIYYTFDEINAIQNNSQYEIDATLDFMVVFVEREGGTLAETKLLRYTRALTEVVLENIDTLRTQDIEVSIFAPVDAIDSMTNAYLRVAGIKIKGIL